MLSGADDHDIDIMNAAWKHHNDASLTNTKKPNKNDG